jgi:hypothetical protein
LKIPAQCGDAGALPALSASFTRATENLSPRLKSLTADLPNLKR